MLEKLGAGLPGRGAHRRQAGHRRLLPGPGRRRRDHRVRADSRGQPAAGGRRRPAGCSTRSTSRTPWPSPDPRPPRRLRGAPEGAHRRGPVQLRGRLAELLRARRRTSPRAARVRPVRAATGHRDDRQGRPEVHRDPSCAGARTDGRRRHRRGPGAHRRQGAGRQPGRQGRHHGRAGRAGPAGRGPQGLRRSPGRPGSSSANPDRFDLVDADPTRGAFLPPHPAARGGPRPPRAARDRGVRPGQHRDRLPTTSSTPSSWPPADGAAWSGRWSPPTRQSPGIVLGVAPWHGRVLVLDQRRRRASRQDTGPRCRTWCTAGRAAPETARSSAASAACSTTCSAPRYRAPRGLSRPSPALGDRRAADHRRRAPVPQEPGRAADRRRRRRRPADHHPGRHRGLRRTVTGDTFYAHMDEEAAAANPFFEGRVAHGYFVVSMAAGLFVYPEPGPVLANFGLEKLRFARRSTPATRSPSTLTAKEISPARRRRLRRGHAGTPSSPTRTAKRSPPTTC